MMMDENNKYKSQYSSLKKDNIKCNNLNFNLNALNVDAIPEPLRSLLASQAQVEEEGIEIGYGTYGNDGKERFVGYNDKDFEFVCIDNNDNQFIVSLTPPTPPPPLPPPPTPVNNVCTVWIDNTPGNFEIFFARSTDGGLTFSEPENISGNAGSSQLPQISSEGNNVYVVWT